MGRACWGTRGVRADADADAADADADADANADGSAVGGARLDLGRSVGR